MNAMPTYDQLVRSVGPRWQSPAVRFVNRFEISETGCWEWLGAKDGNGYGSIGVGQLTYRAHRISWVLYHGPIPDGKEIDHLCRNRGCVNPFHLEPVDHRTNMLRGDNTFAAKARQTHCKRGHEFTDANTYLSKKGRECRTCVRDYQRERMRRVRAAARAAA